MLHNSTSIGKRALDIAKNEAIKVLQQTGDWSKYFQKFFTVYDECLLHLTEKGNYHG